MAGARESHAVKAAGSPVERQSRRSSGSRGAMAGHGDAGGGSLIKGILRARATSVRRGAIDSRSSGSRGRGRPAAATDLTSAPCIRWGCCAREWGYASAPGLRPARRCSARSPPRRPPCPHANVGGGVAVGRGRRCVARRSRVPDGRGGGAGEAAPRWTRLGGQAAGVAQRLSMRRAGRVCPGGRGVSEVAAARRQAGRCADAVDGAAAGRSRGQAAGAAQRTSICNSAGASSPSVLVESMRPSVSAVVSSFARVGLPRLHLKSCASFSFVCVCARFENDLLLEHEGQRVSAMERIGGTQMLGLGVAVLDVDNCLPVCDAALGADGAASGGPECVGDHWLDTVYRDLGFPLSLSGAVVVQ